MRIAHYCEFERFIQGGIRESVRQQRTMLEMCDIDYYTTPRTDVDLLHLNLLGPRSIASALRARRREVPVVIHTHVTAEDFRNSMRLSNLLSKPLRPYLRHAYALGDRLVCPSTYTQRVIEDYTDVETRVISNGVDTAKLEGYESLRHEYLERYDLTPPVVFMVGHVFKRKGLPTFVETAQSMPDLDFVWFGPIERQLKDRSTKRLVDDSPPNCTFTGYINDIRGAYAVGDIFFFPTHEENEGMTLLEAMATEKAIVVRDIETFEWLEHGEHCLKTTGRFEQEINRLRDSTLRTRLGEAAGELSQAYELPEVAKDLEQCYQEVLTRKNAQ